MSWNYYLLQYAFDVGFNATDDFTKADIIEAAYPTIAKKLQGDWIEDSAITIVTSVFRKVCKFFYMINFT
jgi:aspartate kinase